MTIFIHWFYSTHFDNGNLSALFGFKLPSLIDKIRAIKYYFGERSLCYRTEFDESQYLLKAHTFFSVFRKMSAAFIGLYDFDLWDISPEFMTMCNKERRYHMVIWKQIRKRKRFVKCLVTFRTVFFLLSMHSLHWRGELIKLWAQLNQAECKKDYSITLWESVFFWKEGYCKLNKDFS